MQKVRKIPRVDFLQNLMGLLGLKKPPKQIFSQRSGPFTFKVEEWQSYSKKKKNFFLKAVFEFFKILKLTGIKFWEF